MKSITCNCVNPPAMYNQYGFYGVEKNIPVYVPSESVEKYKNAVGWNEFKTSCQYQLNDAKSYIYHEQRKRKFHFVLCNFKKL